MNTALKIPGPSGPPSPPASSSEFVLEVQQGSQKKSYRMRGENLKIGRASDADIVVDDVSCSRLHCILQRNGDDLVLMDNNTRNGTYVNGAKIDGFVKLSGGDIIQIAQTRIQFRRFVRKGALVPPSIRSSVPKEVTRVPLMSREEAPVVVEKKGIPKRLFIYGLIGVVIIGVLLSKETPKLDRAEELKRLKKDPIGVYKMLSESKSKNDEGILKAAEKIAESNTAILVDLETKLIKEEEAKNLEELAGNSKFGVPEMVFREKLAQEHFFSGIREYNYHNYSRAEEQFKAALVIDGSLGLARDYLFSATNRRRLIALDEFKIAKKYFQSRQYTLAIHKFESVRSLLTKDVRDAIEGEWPQIVRNCEEYIGLAKRALGDHNTYGQGSSL